MVGRTSGGAAGCILALALPLRPLTPTTAPAIAPRRRASRRAPRAASRPQASPAWAHRAASNVAGSLGQAAGSPPNPSPPAPPPPLPHPTPAVWDSAIVLAKYFELHASRYGPGTRALDLSAGCGLPGLVLCKLGAEVTATDLRPNLPLLEKNAAANGAPCLGVTGRQWGAAPRAVPSHARAHSSPHCTPRAAPLLPPSRPSPGCAIAVSELSWGAPLPPQLRPPFDVVVVADCMYIRELVPSLLATLAALAGLATEVLVAHGRNRQVRGGSVDGGWEEEEDGRRPTHRRAGEGGGCILAGPTAPHSHRAPSPPPPPLARPAG